MGMRGETEKMRLAWGKELAEKPYREALTEKVQLENYLRMNPRGVWTRVGEEDVFLSYEDYARHVREDRKMSQGEKLNELRLTNEMLRQKSIITRSEADKAKYEKEMLKLEKEIEGIGKLTPTQKLAEEKFALQVEKGKRVEAKDIAVAERTIAAAETAEVAGPDIGYFNRYASKPYFYLWVEEPKKVPLLGIELPLLPKTKQAVKIPLPKYRTKKGREVPITPKMLYDIVQDPSHDLYGVPPADIIRHILKDPKAADAWELMEKTATLEELEIGEK